MLCLIIITIIIKQPSPIPPSMSRGVHADIHSNDFEVKCISDGSKLEERNQEILL
jgi:hypothetical protein